MVPKNMAIFIFVSIAGLTLLFQNCSSSLFALSAGKPVQADDLDEMINGSKKEIYATKRKLNLSPGLDKKFDRKQASDAAPVTYKKDNVSIKIKHKNQKKYAGTFKKAIIKKNKKQFKQKNKIKKKKLKKTLKKRKRINVRTMHYGDLFLVKI